MPDDIKATEDLAPLWLSSWKLHAVIVAFFALGLIGPLRSSAPLVAIYFPGAFIAIGAWAILRHFKGWSPVGQPLRTNLPPTAYLIVATTVLFVAYGVTDRDVYRNGATASLILTVPATLLTAFIVVFRKRIQRRVGS